jgi:hypothetical protein
VQKDREINGGSPGTEDHDIPTFEAADVGVR